jgi:uncharacterized surface protein with fasciclin (FAS1) repeats
MKKWLNIIGLSLLVGGFVFAQDDTTDDATSAEPTVKVEALGVQSGTIMSYLESQSATNLAEGGLCYERPTAEEVAEESTEDTGSSGTGTDDTSDDTSTGDTSSDDSADDSSASEETTDATASYTCLSQALIATGLSETLNAEGNYTLFAPTDDAFQDLAESMTDSEFAALLEDTAQLSQILNYHVLPEARTLNDLATEAASGPLALTTVQGSDITITFENDASEETDTTAINDEAVVRVGSSAASTANAEGDAFVTEEAVQTDNGVVIGIDQVLMLPEQAAQ